MIAYPILDHPNARSSHSRPTPRGGGLGIVVAFTLGMGILYWQAEYARLPGPQFLGVIGAALALAAVSLWDDARDLRFALKLAAQALAEADLLLRNNKNIVDSLSKALAGGAATVGDCVAVLEEW